MAVLVLVRLVAKPGKGAAVADLLAPHVGTDTGMEGCSRIELAVDAAVPDRVLILEQWSSAEAHKAHLAGLQAAGGMAPPLALLAEEPVRTCHAPLDA